MRIGDQRLIVVLGHGGMGEVWRATHLPTGEEVAVKVLTAARVEDPTCRAALRREARSTALLDHPNVVVVHDHGELPDPVGQLPSGAPWLAMELASGDLTGSDRPRTWTDLQDVMRTILAGLAHMHARGIVHRDLKPANVLRVGSR